MILVFSTRWYPDNINEQWYTDFVKKDNFTTDFDYMGIWLWGVPMAFHVGHMVGISHVFVFLFFYF